MNTETLYLNLLQNLPMGAYYVDRHRKICFWNRAAEQITGYSANEIKGIHCQNSSLSHIDLDGKPLCRVDCPLYATLMDGKERQDRVLLHHKDGHLILLHVHIAPVWEQGVIVGAVEYFTQDTAQIFDDDVIGRLSSVAMQDSLTKLPNRRYLESFLSFSLAEYRCNASLFAVLFADIDNFSTVNNTYGHSVGDTVLSRIADSMSHSSSSHDLLGRWGGEEFLGIYRVSSPKECMKIANALHSRVRETAIPVQNSSIFVTVSVGITLVQPGDTEQSLIERADRLMYEAKRSGKNRVVCDC